ncbi:MAG: hypothetical protein LBD25_07415 [Coriobacteriales bacterium]|jgi:hypothetical protein|nr:hypothetical protein [Coriobacteriales bacterium]
MNTPKSIAQLMILGIFLLCVSAIFALDAFLAYKPMLDKEVVIAGMAVAVAILVFCVCMRVWGTKDDSAQGKKTRNLRVAIVSAVILITVVVASFMAADAFAQFVFLQYLRAFLVVAAIATTVAAYAGLNVATVVALIGFAFVALLVTMGMGDLSNSTYDTIVNGRRISASEEHVSTFVLIVAFVTGLEYLGFVVMSFMIVWFCAPRQQKR